MFITSAGEAQGSFSVKAVTSQSGSLDNLLQAASDLGQQFCVSVSLIQIFSFINERSALTDHKKLLKFRIPELQTAGPC